MYALIYDALEVLEDGDPLATGPGRRHRASARLISRIGDASQLRHARYCGLASEMGEIVVRALLQQSRESKRALFTVGLDLHRPIARLFGERLRNAGPRRLNPIMFPHTLPSASAVTLGALYGAHVASIALDGPRALSDALSASHLLLEAGVADEVLVLIASADCLPGEAADHVELCSVGLLLATQPFPGYGLRFEPAAAGPSDHPHYDSSLPSSSLISDAQRLLEAARSSRPDERRISGFTFTLFDGTTI